VNAKKAEAPVWTVSVANARKRKVMEGCLLNLSKWFLSAILGSSIWVFPIEGLAQMVGPKVIPVEAFCGPGGPEDLFIGIMEHGAVPTHSLELEGVGMLYIVQSREPATSIVIHNTEALRGVGMTCMFWYTPHLLQSNDAELPELPEKEQPKESI